MKRRTFHQKTTFTVLGSALGLTSTQSVYALNGWRSYDPTAVNGSGNPCKSTLDNFISQADPQPQGGFDLTPLGYSYTAKNQNNTPNITLCYKAIRDFCDLYDFTETQRIALENQCCLYGGS
jgi:hypothetical protein